jgi:hypothetical protein
VIMAVGHGAPCFGGATRTERTGTHARVPSSWGHNEAIANDKSQDLASGDGMHEGWVLTGLLAR